MQIKEIILQTHLINELKNFYLNTIGLKLLNENDKSFSVKAGSSVIKFNKFKLNKNEFPFYHFAFNIPQNQFSEAKKWLAAKVQLIKLDGEDEFHFKSWNAHSIYFYDPAGNIIELIARHNLTNSTDLLFSGESLLCISEIGIPVINLKGFLNRLSEDVHLPLFSGDNETFSAIGNEEGLFILVNKGRKWYPDCPEAEIFPLSVEINSDKESEIIIDEINFKIKLTKKSD